MTENTLLRTMGDNGGPPLDDRPTMAEAQENPDVSLRPSYLCRYAGRGAPMRSIVGIGGLGAIGRWVLLRCGHWREVRDWDMMPLTNRKRPSSGRCGCCRVGIAPDRENVDLADRFAVEMDA